MRRKREVVITVEARCDRCDAGHGNHTMLVIEPSNRIARAHSRESASYKHTDLRPENNIFPNVNNECFVSLLRRIQGIFHNDLTCIWMMFGHDDSLLNAVKSWMKKGLDWMSKMSWVDDELKSRSRGLIEYGWKLDFENMRIDSLL